MSAVINNAGWSIWSTGDERTETAYFGEYGNTGAGASGPRASFATAMTSPVSITSVLGSNYTSAAWYDSSYM